jgi:uncharacterized protein YfaS (alpha-2-macroglobulin family)/TolA-binding protein
MRFRHNSILLGTFLVLMTLATRTWAQEEKGTGDWEAGVPNVPGQIRELMQDREYGDAIIAIDKTLAERDEDAADEDAPKVDFDYLVYLKGRALHLMEQYDAAIATYGQVEKQFPKSPWARRARFGAAVSHARKGDYLSAEIIFKKEVQFLLSVGRKQEIAGIYLEFADAYFAPPKDDLEKKPNYKKALEFYQKALQVGPKPEKRVEVELLVTRCFQKLNNHAEAAKRLQQFIKDHKDDALVIEAKFQLGESQLRQGQYAPARRTWQDLLADHADAKSERIAEATYSIGKTYRIPQPPNDEELSLAVAALEKFIEKYPDHKLASEAHLYIAKSYLHRGRFEDGVTALQRFLGQERYADAKETPQARNLLGQAYLRQRKFDEALAAWRDYLAKHPTHNAWSNVQRAIVNTEYEIGLDHMREKRYDEARKAWQAFLVKYPLDSRSPQILHNFGDIHLLEEKHKDAIAAWRRLVSKYPGTQQSSSAQFLIGVVTEDKLGDLAEALKEYKKVTWGNSQAPAKQRIAQLTAKSMRIVSERVFRSDEAPRIKLTSRNIESVVVETYVVDLETYFRKMHLAGGVEGLDIDLIDPDKKTEFKLPDYEEYKLTEHEIEVPLPKGDAGVMAVAVSSKTSTATTLVIQSDLDMIVKSSRDELFVFAQNMRTGKVWPKARLLLSNGADVYGETETGDDGVLQKSFDQLKNANDVRVFAIADGHVASNIVNLQGVGVARGLANKGYVYTDRPAYRPGQVVHVRGVIRKVDGDAYTVEKDKKFNVAVFDHRNRLVHEDKIALSAFGSFRSHFMLPDASPQGSYRVVVTEDTKRSTSIQSYQGHFAVHQYKLEPVQLTIDSERTVYYRGEEITGKIVAKYYYGAPLAGREIRYKLEGGDGRVHTAKTNEKGEVEFKLPTRDYAESRALRLIASLPERNLNVAKPFFLSTRGYALNVSTVRSVYLAGDTFETTVTATDAEGESVARKLTLKVLEQTRSDGMLGERLVSEHELTTDEKDGKARHTLKLDKGANYILRAEGTDRFENPISAARIVSISDDKDRVRLRILANRHTYKVGEQANVTLHWREQPSLALVTFQGAKILDYQILNLKKGANKLPIPMTAKLAPNFDLSVAVMTDSRPKKNDDAKKLPRRFHSASSPFAVGRELIVKVEPQVNGKPLGDAPIRPGDEVEIVVTTTDPQGKPVSAEVSLAMVEQSLLKRFSPNVGAIQHFFRGNNRQSAVRTTSSITFAYRPQTRGINKRLLAEQERIIIQEEEQVVLAAGGVQMFGDFAAAQAPVDRYRQQLNSYFGKLNDQTVARTGAPSYALGLQLEVPRGGRAEASQSGRQRLELFNGQRRYANGDDFYEAEGQGEGQGQGSLQLGQAADGGSHYLPQDALGPQVQQQFQRQVQTEERITGQVAGRFFGGGAENALPQSRTRQADNGSLNWSVNALNAPLGEDGDAVYNYELAARMPTRGRVQLSGEREWARWYGEANKELGEVLAIEAGVQSNVDFDGGKDADNLAVLIQLAKTGAEIIASRGPQETGYWNPAIVTDEKGTAEITLTAPDRSTAWTLTAKGVTTDTLAGEATTDVVARKDLFGELKLPLAFTDGDRAQIKVSIHNSLEKLPAKEGAVEVKLTTTIGGKAHTETKQVKFDAAGIQHLIFDATLNRSEKKQGRTVDDEVSFELVLTSGNLKDTVRRALPIKPLGMPVFSTVAGESTGDATAQIAPPPKMALSDPSLQILVGPSVEQSLLDVVLGAAPVCQINAGQLATGLDVATSDLMAAIAVQKLLAGTRDQDSPQAESLDSRVRSSVSLLVSSQLDNGAWSWTGRGGGANRYTSARAVWALSLARDAGYTVPTDAMNRAVKFLQSQVATTKSEDLESQSVLIHALAASGNEDYRVANRLYRSRQALSTAALAYLSLAFVEMDRKTTANELLELLAQRNLDVIQPRRTAVGGSLPWNYSSAELRALYALAIQLSSEPAAGPANGETRELITWLMAHRSGHRWSPEKATGPAALAVAHWYSKTRFANEHYKLAVFVNDVKVKDLDIEAGTGTQVVEVPADLLKDVNKKDTRQRVHFQITGRGRFTYQCILSGFVPADKLADTTQAWRVERHYEPAPLEYDGRPINRGFGVLQGSYQTFRNPLTQLPVGRRGRVEVRVHRNVFSGTPQEQLEYLVLTEPLPSGASVVENSVHGGFDRYEISPGAITFYIGSRHGIGAISYELHGYLAGSYNCGPSVVRNAYRADQMTVTKSKSLAVLPQGAKSVDKYRLTPQELWELGVKNFEAKDFKAASGYLNDLFANWNLKPDVYKRSAKMLLDIHLETGPAHKVVHYFEIIKQRWKDLEIPFDTVVKVGHAYHEIGEYESAYIVFRVLAESSFNRESGVAGFLQGQGEFVRSVDVMNDLLRQYPPEPYIASATYALAQRIYAQAPNAAADPKLREAKINRVDLVRQSLKMLDNFLSAYPDDPAADQASFSVASGLLELEAYERAIVACNKFAKRYPESQWLDSYWYVIGFCHFALGKTDDALAMCKKVADAKRLDKNSGREVDARNKWRAIYIMGQVYHSLGKAADAIEEYTRVKSRFTDASQAIEYFARKSIELPEVTAIKPGDKAEVELKFRNVATCDVKVYRIDLMKFSLLKRNLAEITKINLAGIRPLHEESIKLGEGKDYRDRDKALELPLKDEGAYLIVARGENLHTSGLALVTPLVVEIQEEKQSGRVRTTVKDTMADKYISDVHVKVIGSANDDFVSGDTDLRGVFVADGINGTSTVIAQADSGSYAFFRGEEHLGQAPQAPNAPPAREPAAAANKPDANSNYKGNGKSQLLDQIFEDNRGLNSDQSEQLKKLYEGGKDSIDASKF